MSPQLILHVPVVATSFSANPCCGRQLNDQRLKTFQFSLEHDRVPTRRGRTMRFLITQPFKGHFPLFCEELAKDVVYIMRSLSDVILEKASRDLFVGIRGPTPELQRFSVGTTATRGFVEDVHQLLRIFGFVDPLHKTVFVAGFSRDLRAQVGRIKDAMR